jgi:Tfp pilus assembly PilM family ATPase
MNSLKGALYSLLKETIAGLDIGEDYISAASLSIGKNGLPDVEKLGCIEKKPNLSNSAIACRLRGLWHKHKIKTRTVASCFRSPSLNIKYFKYPRLSDKELKSALYLEAEHTFQRPRRDLYIDWLSFPKQDNNIEGVLAAAPKEDVKSHISILRMAGLYPVIIDIGCMAVANLYKRLKDQRLQEPVCVVNANNGIIDISILSEGSRIYPRSAYSAPSSARDNKGFIIENIGELLRYYQFKLHQKPVEKLMITGRLSHDKVFMEELKKSVEIPVDIWDPLKEIVLKQPAFAEKKELLGPMTAASLGLALENI